MNVLFLGYWGFNEGLTQATILPHLQILSDFENVEEIIFCSIERTEETVFDINIPKVKHIPLYSVKSKIPLYDKIQDFTVFPKRIIELCQKHEIDKIICRGAPAGALGFLVWKKIKVPYYVESYEPHAEYMLESGVWKKWDPRYLLQKKWEKKQNKTAAALMPVAENYAKKLIALGLSSKKIDIIPCCVDLKAFSRSEKFRLETRQQLGILEHQKVFIYVGKFGGLYVEDEAILVFKNIIKANPNSRFIILTTSDTEKLKFNIENANIDPSLFHITNCRHADVIKYLSASDVALALYKQGESKQHLSPIKIGEYWASGLPVILPSGIGDDSNIIKNEGGGIVFDSYTENAILKVIKELDSEFNNSANCIWLAKKYRSFDIAKKVYEIWYS